MFTKQLLLLPHRNFETMAAHNDLGVLGERLALDYLKEKHYQILETNWACGHKEIDIIATDGDTLVIVEVRTRQCTCLVDPEVTVDRFKQNHLIWAANNYVIRNKLDCDTRFDIISIVIDRNKQSRIEHLENAFYPMLNR